MKIQSFASLPSRGYITNNGIVAFAFQVAAVMLATSPCGEVVAQEIDDLGLPGVLSAGYLGIPEVRDELQLTGLEIKTVDLLLRKYDPQVDAYRTSRQAAKEEERAKIDQEQLIPLNEAWKNDLQLVLEPRQIRRLRQIELLALKHFAIREDQTVKALLKVTSKQVAEMEQVVQDFRSSAKAVIDEKDRFAPAELRQKLDQLALDADAKLEAILSEEQEAKWKSLLGPPLPFKWQ